MTTECCINWKESKLSISKVLAISTTQLAIEQHETSQDKLSEA